MRVYQIFHHNGKNVVIFTNSVNVTEETVEDFAHTTAIRYGLRPDSVIWIELYLHHISSQNESYNLVRFTWNGSRFTKPIRQKLTYAEVNQLCGQNVAPAIGSGRDSQRRFAALRAYLAMNWASRGIIFLDTETTGLGHDDEIVEIAILTVDGTPLLDTLVKPVKRIPASATNIHGISNADIAYAPTLVDLKPELERIFESYPAGLAIYNADYDMRLLRQSLKARTLEGSLLNGYLTSLQGVGDVCCVMKLYAQFYGDWNYEHNDFKWQRLENAARQCGLTVPPNAHRARADADLTRRVMGFMASRLDKLDNTTLSPPFS